MIVRIVAYLLLVLLLGRCSGQREGLPTASGSGGTDAPEFVSTPDRSVVHNERYRYIVEARTIHDDEPIYTAHHIPGWLTFDTFTRTLAGTPTADNLGIHRVVLAASHGNLVTLQSFDVVVTLHEVPGEAWVISSPYRWTHDGQPYRGRYCDLYSDGANDDVKREMGALAEQTFAEVLHLFAFDRLGDFRFPPGYERVQMYVNRLHKDNVAASYWGCVIVTIRCARMDQTWRRYAEYTLRHEMTHAFEFLIEGAALLGTDVWFREGMAVLIGGGSPGGVVTECNELEWWRSQNQNAPNRGNPITIHRWADFPVGANTDQYYRFFELAVRYLVDPEGGRRSWQDLLTLLYDVRKGVAFRSAFRNNCGMSLETFENEFFECMRLYISRKRSP